MNKARGGTIVGSITAAVIIGIMVALAYNSPEVNESQFEIPIQEPIGLSELVEVNETGSEFVVDEEGKKTYVINVGDAPDLGEK